MQRAFGRGALARNSQLQLRGRQAVAREQAARGNRIAGDGTPAQLEHDEVLDVRQGVNHFNAQEERPGPQWPGA